MNEKVKETLGEKIKEILLEEPVTEQNPLTEEKLTEIFGASRTPIREALKELEQEGIIKRKRGKGIYLRKPTIKEIAEIYDVRAVLEGFAGRLATERIEEKDIQEIENLARSYNQSLKEGNLEKVDEADLSFHRKLVKLSGNSYILKIFDTFSILEKSFSLDYLLTPLPRKETSPYPHEEIIKSLRERDGEKCERIIRLHIQHGKQGLIERAVGIKLNHF